MLLDVKLPAKNAVMGSCSHISYFKRGVQVLTFFLQPPRLGIRFSLLIYGTEIFSRVHGV